MHDPELKKKNLMFEHFLSNKPMLGTGLYNIMPPSMKYSEAYAVSCIMPLFNTVREDIYFFTVFFFLFSD